MLWPYGLVVVLMPMFFFDTACDSAPVFYSILSLNPICSLVTGLNFEPLGYHIRFLIVPARVAAFLPSHYPLRSELYTRQQRSELEPIHNAYHSAVP